MDNIHLSTKLRSGYFIAFSIAYFVVAGTPPVIHFLQLDLGGNFLASAAQVLPNLSRSSWITTYKSLWVVNILFCLCAWACAFGVAKHCFVVSMPERLNSTFRLFIIAVVGMMGYLAASESVMWLLKQTVVISDRFVDFPDEFRSVSMDVTHVGWLDRWVWLLGFTLAIPVGARVLWELAWIECRVTEKAGVFHHKRRRHCTGLDFSRAVTFSGYLLCLVTVTAFLFFPVSSSSRWVSGPEEYDIWTKVRLHTPKDALIFTDQTSAQAPLSRNYHAVVTARRQFFIVATDTLARNPVRLAKRLAENEAVLLEQKSPGQVRIVNDYSAYFAVVSDAHPQLKHATLVYQNKKYRLYSLTGRD